MNKKSTKKEILARIAARKEARSAEREKANTVKFARMRRVAEEEPKEVGAALDELATAFGLMADAIEGLRTNLNLVDVDKAAKLAVRIVAARKYASGFRRIAEEQ